jgi:hypothetical protein
VSYSSSGIQIRQFQLGDTYIPITACMACSGFMCENAAGSFTICTDSADATTEKVVSGWFGITSSSGGSGNSRWSPREVMFFAKGTGTLVMTYIS